MSLANFQIKKRWLGEVEYAQALELQEEYLQIVGDDFNPTQGYLLGLEHPSTVTLGVRSELGEQKFPFPVYKVKRGGEIVIHNPGQLVIYPVLNLSKLNISIKDLVCKLESCIQETLQSFSISTFKKKEPGIYTNAGKIAFVGLQVSRGVTKHGIAINISNNLNDFSIAPICGVKNQPMDKVSHYAAINTQDFFDLFCEKLLVYLVDLKGAPKPLCQSANNITF